MDKNQLIRDLKEVLRVLLKDTIADMVGGDARNMAVLSLTLLGQARA